MLAHLRANLWLLFLTVVICCVLYPAAVWVVGQTIFRNQAQGSLLDKDGNPVSDPKDAVGSALIAQSFNSPWFFQSRPSAASYNAAASGGSNYGASNPKLRGRVAQLLGTIARYREDGPRHGDPVGPDVEMWFQEQTKAGRDLANEWVAANPTLAQGWATSSDAIKAYVTQWAADHSDVTADWKNDNKDVKKDPGPDDLVAYFFKSYAKEHPGTWPVQTQQPDKDGKPQTIVKPDVAGADIQSMFFDTWLSEQAKAKSLDPLKDFEQVPADMVTASGSGLDPDISLRNAEYQRPTVVQGVVDKLVGDYEGKEENQKANKKVSDEMKQKLKDDVDKAVGELLKGQAYRPMWGLTGDGLLLNVLRLNLSLKAKMDALALK